MEIDVTGFDRIAKEVFAPLYPVVAEQIVSQTGITKGRCLDMGCGGGYLGLAIAKITQLETILFDESPQMLELAQKYIRESGLESRVKTLQGDIHSIPLEDGTVDIAVSRGSLFFWDDHVQAFREIYRVLAPGGITYMGGGFGNQEIFNEIEKKMFVRDPEWTNKRKKRVSKSKVAEYRTKLEQAGIGSYEIKHDGINLWIVIRKTA